MTSSHIGRNILRHGSRRAFTALIVAMVGAPGLRAQEPETQDAPIFDLGQLNYAAGARMEIYGLVSPGASFQATWDTPGERGSWLGAQIHAQVVRWEPHPDVTINPDKIRRDYHFAGRFKAGFGRGDGPLFYAFAEAGVGMIGTEPETKRGDTYLLSGVGAGVGITLLPITFAVEGTLGQADRPSSDQMDSFVMILSYNFP